MKRNNNTILERTIHVYIYMYENMLMKVISNERILKSSCCTLTKREKVFFILAFTFNNDVIYIHLHSQ
jgi:hypothetical protein